MASIGDVFLRLLLDDADFEKQIVAKARAGGEKAGLSMGGAIAAGISRSSTKIGETLAGVGKNLSRTGESMSRNITLPLIAAGGAAAKFALDFDTAGRQVVGLTDVTGDGLDGIKDKILALGPAVGKGPQELIEAFYFIASAGFKADEAMEVLETSAKAAAAGLGETQTIAQVLGGVINAYGRENITAAKAADILTEAVSQGTAEASGFASVIGNVVPGAAALGVSFDQVTAAMAGMTLTGVGVEESATSLIQIFSSLQKPTVQAEEALEGLGLSSAELRRQLREEGLLATLRTLEERFAGNETAAAAVFGNIRALRGVTALLTLDSEQLNAVFGKVADSTGRMQTAYEETEGPQREIDRAMADMQATAIELGEDVLPIVVEVLKSLAGGAKELAKWWRSLDDGTKRLIVQALAFTAAAGPVLLVVGKLTAGAGALFKMVGFLAGAKGIPRLIGFLKGGGGLIGLVIALGFAANEAAEGFNRWIIELTRGKKGLKEFEAIAAITGDEMKANLIGQFLDKWGLSAEEFAQAVEMAGGDVDAAFDALHDSAGDLGEALAALYGPTTNMTEEWAEAWRGSSTSVTTDINGMIVSAKRAGGEIPGELAGGMAGGAGQVGNAAGEMADEIPEALVSARNAASEQMQGMVRDILGILADSKKDIRAEMRAVKEAITNPYKDVRHALDIETALAMEAVLEGLRSGSTPAAATVAQQVEDWLAEYALLEPGVLERGKKLNPALQEGISRNLNATVQWVKENVIGDQLELFDSLPAALDAAGFEGLAAYVRGLERARNLRLVAKINAVRADVKDGLGFSAFGEGYGVGESYSRGLNASYWDSIAPKAEQIRAGLGGFLRFAGSPDYTGSRLAGEGVGESYITALVRRLRAGLDDLGGVLGQAFVSQPMVPSLVGSSSYGAARGISGEGAGALLGGNKYDVKIQTPLREHTTLEVAAELRRAEYLGVIS